MLNRDNVQLIATLALRAADKTGSYENVRRVKAGKPPKQADGHGAKETAIAAMRSFCKDQAKYIDGYDGHDVAKPRRSTRSRRPLRDFELLELCFLAETGGNDAELDSLLIEIGIFTGARREGAVNMTVGSLERRAQLAYVDDKGHRTAPMPVPADLIDKLLEHAITRGGDRCDPNSSNFDPNSPLFWMKAGSGARFTPLTDRRFDTLLTRLQAATDWAATEQVGYHHLRHTMSQIIKARYGQHVAQRFLRHADREVTDRYGRCDVSELACALTDLFGYTHPWSTESTTGAPSSSADSATAQTRTDPERRNGGGRTTASCVEGRVVRNQPIALGFRCEHCPLMNTTCLARRRRILVLVGAVVSLVVAAGFVPAEPSSTAAAATVTNNAIVKRSQNRSDPTAWLLIHGQRYWIPDGATYNCLRTAGVPGPVFLTDAELNARPDQRGQRASCGNGNNPHGHLDSVTLSSAGKVKVRGWAADRNVVTRSIDIHVYVGGKSGTAGAELHKLGAANVYRPDVNKVYPGYGNYHGYDKVLSTSKWGPQEVCAYALNVGPGTNVLLGCKTVTIKAPLPSNASSTCAKTTTFNCLTKFGYGSASTKTWTENHYRYDAASGYHNCTRFVGFFMAKYAGIKDPGASFGDAWNWGLTDVQGGQKDRMSMREHGYTVSSTPRVGSIAWWNKNTGKGSSGHVGIVVAAGTDFVIVASDNYKLGALGSVDVTKITKTGGSWPSGFIYIGL